MKDYNCFHEVVSTIKLIANNGGIASLNQVEAQAVLQAIQDLHAAGTAVIEVYDIQWDTQEVGAEPLEQAIERLARTIDCTGGESR